MSPRWPHYLAIALGIYIGLVFAYAVRGQEPESAMGSLPVPPAVRMTGECQPGFQLSTGILTVKWDEMEGGGFAIGSATYVQLDHDNPRLHHARILEGQDVELIIRAHAKDE